MKPSKISMFVLSACILTFSANAGELEEYRKNYERIVYDENERREELENNYDAQNDIKKEIYDLDMRLSEAQIDIDNTEKEILDVLMEIDEAREKLEEAEEKRQSLNERASDRLRFIYENGELDPLEIAGECGSISDYARYRQYAEDIMKYDAELLEELKANEECLREELERIEERSEAKTALEKFKTEKEFEMAVMYEEKNRLLEEYRQDAKRAEKELAELEEAADKVYDIIVNIEKNKEFVDTYTGGELEWPVEGRYYVSSGYVGRISPVGNGYEFHTGIDIPAPEGYEIRAAEDGTVINAGWINGYGNTVIIDHGGGISTLYAHNSSVEVENGQSVHRGDVIALCGSTGYATGSHCHFEVRVNGEHTDPWEYLKRDRE
ncbi:MAG TPA: peptidoglycan DD-metalloendopeptidase family protein [Firmicutes bacterium]|nr:peptidoglycan DD-metalloendopeptidase family protein [Bacillota bacterium]